MAISKETAQKLYELLKSVSNSEEITEFYTILNEYYRELQSKIVKQFSIGDPVEFDSKRGMTVQGKITKLNGKSVKLQSTDYVTWTVAPSLLRKIPKSAMKKAKKRPFSGTRNPSFPFGD